MSRLQLQKGDQILLRRPPSPKLCFRRPLCLQRPHRHHCHTLQLQLLLLSGHPPHNPGSRRSSTHKTHLVGLSVVHTRQASTTGLRCRLSHSRSFKSTRTTATATEASTTFEGKKQLGRLAILWQVRRHGNVVMLTLTKLFIRFHVKGEPHPKPKILGEAHPILGEPHPNFGCSPKRK